MSLPTPNQSLPVSQHPARGFAQTFGLHPMVAFFTLGCDSMLFGSELTGIGLVFSIPVGLIVGYLSYLGQCRFFDDDHEAALVKGSMLAVLVALPTSIPAFIYAPLGFVGLFRRSRS